MAQTTGSHHLPLSYFTGSTFRAHCGTDDCGRLSTRISNFPKTWRQRRRSLSMGMLGGEDVGVYKRNERERHKKKSMVIENKDEGKDSQGASPSRHDL